jgi:hypothetical protein
MHRPVRNRFQRNPYTVNNIGDIWESGVVDIGNLSKYNDGFKYFLNAIHTFSKYAYAVPLRTKTEDEVTSAFRTILSKTPRSLKPNSFGLRLPEAPKVEGIEFRVIRNPNVKCAVFEMCNGTLNTKMYRYFTRMNSYRYIDVLDKFVDGHNNAVHSTTSMAPHRVTGKDVLKIWNRMTEEQARLKRAPAINGVGQTERISKEKMKFAKAFEQNYSAEIFKISKVVRRSPRPLYELEDLRGMPIEGQFYKEELTPVKISRRTEYRIDKIMDTRVRRGIREHIVR